jgi:hypothetical protein
MLLCFSIFFVSAMRFANLKCHHCLGILITYSLLVELFSIFQINSGRVDLTFLTTGLGV